MLFVGMRRLVFLLLATFALFLGAQSAAAASCNVYDDFNDNGKLDGSYSISCLRTALKNVQGDAGTYTEIVPVIQAKIYAENRASAQRPPQGSSSAPNRTGAGVTPANPPTGKSTSPGSKSGTSKSGTKSGTKSGSTTGTTSTESPGTTSTPGSSTTLGDLTAGEAPPATTDKGLHAAIDNLGPKKATDVPTPVIVLGVFALLLIAFGSAGIVLRRRRGSSFDASDDAGDLSH
jgi:cobalamin biosynthesis Mg chelatase CobN